MTKKILLFLLLLSSLPIAYLQAQTIYTHTANGKIWKYTLYGSSATIVGATNIDGTSATGEINIPSKIGSATVTVIGDGAFYLNKNITKLKLPEGLTTIRETAFYQCTGLTGKINLPKTLTRIGSSAFVECENLTAITFESGTNLTVIPYTSGAFNRCFNLEYIDATGVTFVSGLNRVTKYVWNTFFGGLAPYTMVYLPSSVPAAEYGEENFVIGGVCDNFVLYDSHGFYSNSRGCNYPIQYNFTATKAEYQGRGLFSGSCQTICLPFKTKLPLGMRAYKLVAKTREGKAFRFVSIADGNGIFQLEANTPYLVRYITNSSNLKASNVEVKATPATMEVALADGKTFFGGTTTNIDNATAASQNIYNLRNNTWYPIKTTDTRGYVHSFRAYIRTTGGTPAKGFAMVIDDDENATTDIDNAAELTEDELRSGKHTFYTLDGRRAGTNYDTLKSGEMYVVKGQKFYKF